MLPRVLIRIRTLLEFGIDAEGDLYAFPWMENPDVPRVTVLRHSLGHVVYFRRDVPGEVRRQIEMIGPDSAFETPERVRQVLGSRRTAPAARFRSHYILMTEPPTDTSGVVRHGSHFLTFDAERPVSWAWTVREHAVAEEGSVETIETFRRQGFGRRVLASWTKYVRDQGKLPLLGIDTGDGPATGLATNMGGKYFANSVTFA
ncbi:MAG: GNAT family N-acetyltransferase [Thermoplasmata archaeon]